MSNVMRNIVINDSEKLLEIFIYITKYSNLVKMSETNRYLVNLHEVNAFFNIAFSNIIPKKYMCVDIRPSVLMSYHFDESIMYQNE